MGVGGVEGEGRGGRGGGGGGTRLKSVEACVRAGGGEGGVRCRDLPRRRYGVSSNCTHFLGDTLLENGVDCLSAVAIQVKNSDLCLFLFLFFSCPSAGTTAIVRGRREDDVLDITRKPVDAITVQAQQGQAKDTQDTLQGPLLLI